MESPWRIRNPRFRHPRRTRLSSARGAQTTCHHTPWLDQCFYRTYMRSQRGLSLRNQVMPSRTETENPEVRKRNPRSGSIGLPWQWMTQFPGLPPAERTAIATLSAQGNYSHCSTISIAGRLLITSRIRRGYLPSPASGLLGTCSWPISQSTAVSMSMKILSC